MMEKKTIVRLIPLVPEDATDQSVEPVPMIEVDSPEDCTSGTHILPNWDAVRAFAMDLVRRGWVPECPPDRPDVIEFKQPDQLIH